MVDNLINVIMLLDMCGRAIVSNKYHNGVVMLMGIYNYVGIAINVTTGTATASYSKSIRNSKTTTENNGMS